MQTAAMNSTALFQYYLDNKFRVPKEMKLDIVYCQRSLKAHIKVHQMVLDVYKSQANPDPIQKKRIIDELETQIYEINAEQHYLLLRLRRLIDDFYKVLNRKGVPVLPEIMNDVISNELVPHINDQSLLIYPVSVRLRATENQLIEKYFEVKNEQNDAASNNYYEILDSDEEAEKKATHFAAQAKIKQQQQPKQQHKPSKDYLQQTEKRHHQQKSLLKPIGQRISHREHRASNETPYIDATKFLQVSDEPTCGNLKGFTSQTAAGNYKHKQEANTDGKNVAADESNVSKNVKMSRMNLRQALKKVQHETMAAKAAASIPSQGSKNSNVTAVATVDAVPTAKKYEGRARPSRSGNVANNLPSMATVKPIEVISSSDDSTPERSVTPQQQAATSSFPSESVDVRIQPEEFGQEMFLRLFGLFTPKMHLQMQQRRSKRKRRNVQSNERSDYHYGRIEYGSYPPPEDKKKRKDFLLSPQVKQRLQSKRPKRRSAEKSDDATSTSRSSSSSPDEKRGCNECLKGGGSLEKCEGCTSFYHATCHRETDSIDDSRRGAVKAKLCPACKRQKKRTKIETERLETLQSTAKELQVQMAVQNTRRASLQQESEMCKTQMNKIYNFVKSIKSDQKNNSD